MSAVLIAESSSAARTSVSPCSSPEAARNFSVSRSVAFSSFSTSRTFLRIQAIARSAELHSPLHSLAQVRLGNGVGNKRRLVRVLGEKANDDQARRTPLHIVNIEFSSRRCPQHSIR